LFLLNFSFNFFYSFLFFTLAQFIGFYFYGEYIKFINSKLAIEAEIKAMEEISKISTDVICPCDKRIVTTIPLNLKEKNEYICQGCTKKVSVFIETKTAIATEPMDETLLDDVKFIEEIKEIVKQQDDLQRSTLK
jgi:transposase-like protein